MWRLHAAGSSVWLAAGDAVPVPVPGGLPVVLQQLVDRCPPQVRILGATCNASLICRVYESLPDGCSLYLGTPAICEGGQELADPGVSLCRSRQLMLSSSLGGWHAAMATEVDVYSWVDDPDVSAETATADLLRQPVWADLSWIPGIDPVAMRSLFGMVRDPRWFVDWERPERLTRLCTYLGLRPRTLAKACRGDLRTVRARRAATVLQCTERGRACPGIAGGIFLSRWADMGQPPERLALRQARAFVTFWVRAWQQRISDLSPRPTELFVPEFLFRPAELASYRRHVAAVLLRG